MKEEWRLIKPGTRQDSKHRFLRRGCLVSNLGRVRTLARISSSGHNLRSRLYKPKHDQVDIGWIGILVLYAFKGPPMKGQVSRHLNDNRSDNCLSNLAWGSRRDNAEDGKRNGIYLKTPEHCAKISAACKGRVISEEQKRSISNTLKGRIFTEEHRRKLSIANLKRAPATAETRAKISASGKGKHSGPRKPFTKEHRAAISRAAKIVQTRKRAERLLLG